MKHKKIKITYDNIVEIYKNKTEVAAKFNYSPQHIHNILNGLKKDNFIIYNKKILYIDYATDEECKNDDLDNIDTQIINEQLKKQKRIIYNKIAYEKRMNKITT